MDGALGKPFSGDLMMGFGLLSVVVAALSPYSSRFREGTNQILSMSADSAGDDRWFTPDVHFSIDSRVGAGPAWSPVGWSSG